MTSAYGFDWDEANTEHIARHDVTPEEAEAALLDPDQLPARAYSPAGEERLAAIGATGSGRILYVVFTARADKIRVGIGVHTRPNEVQRIMTNRCTWPDLRREEQRQYPDVYAAYDAFLRAVQAGEHPDADRPFIPVRSIDEIPAFVDEGEEHEYWGVHEFSDELWQALPPAPPRVLELLEQERARRGREAPGLPRR